jgi:peptide deformylase
MDVLRKKSEPVSDINGEIIELVENMFYTMNNADGIGLAAPQVNKNIQIAIVDISVIEKYKDIGPIAMINPVILETFGEKIHNEGCLSLPLLRGDIVRPERIYLKYYDLNMKEIKMEFDGFFSRVMQHEIDHLHGILFVDHLSEDDFNKNKSLLKKIKSRKVETDYPLFNPKEMKS